MNIVQTRLEKIAHFVQDRLHEMAERYPGEWRNPVYRWEHTLRVANYGRQLAEREGADVERAVVGCLLHDVAHFDPLENPKDHGREGARLSRPFLLALGYSPGATEEICYAIAVHVDGDADFEHHETPIAGIVTDADNIDRFGAYRVLQHCLPHMADYDAMIAYLRERVETLKDYRGRRLMETDAGHALFNRQLDLQIGFFEALIAESRLTRLPEL